MAATNPKSFIGPELPPFGTELRPTPYSRPRGEAGFDVWIGGNLIDSEVAGCIQDLSIDQSADAADHLTLRLLPRGSHLRWVDSESFAAGAPIRVQLGYGRMRTTVFDGEVVGVSLELGAEGTQLTVTAYNVLHRLGRGLLASLQPNHTTLGDIVGDIAVAHQLRAYVEEGGTEARHAVVNRRSQSDLEFLRLLAAETGQELRAEGRDIFLRKAKDNKKAPLQLDLASDVLSFSGNIDESSQVDGVEVCAVDNESGTVIRRKVDNPESNDQSFGSRPVRAVLPGGVSSVAQAQVQGDAELARMRRNRRTASVLCFGNPELRVGESVYFPPAGVGRRFAGVYFIESVQHSMSAAAGFRTRMSLGGARAALAARASGSTNERRLSRAHVTKSDDDLGRVRVRFPWMTEQEESDLLWVLSPKRGLFFMPVEGDQVLVAFPDGLLESGYVLGALWSHSNQPPSASRERRIIRSASGHVIELDDTKDAEKISIVDKSGGSKIVLDAKQNKLSIESGGDLEIKAKGKLRLQADEGVNVNDGALEVSA